MKAFKNTSRSFRRAPLRPVHASRIWVESLEKRCMLADILGTASTFAILGASTVTNAGATNVSGDVGVSPGTAITGFGPGVITAGALHLNDAAASQAHADLATAIGDISGEVATTDLSGQDLGGLTLTPGVYHFATSAALTGILTLDAQGDANARFDFQIGTTLGTAANSTINIINGGNADNVYFQVGTSATLAADTAFEGNILAGQSVTLAAGANLLDGRALALNAAVTMSDNQVTVPQPPNTVTTPVQTEADLSVTNTTTAGTVVAGNTVSYTVTVANAGPSDAQNVTLSDLVPANTTFVSDTQTSGPSFTITNPVAGDTGTISGTIGTLTAGASASFTVVAQVSPTATDGTTISNTANVSTDTTDPSSANNSQTVTTTVQSQANISVTNTTAGGPVLAGDTISYTVTVANAGPSAAQTVALSDLVPSNTTFVSDTQTSGPSFTLSDPAVGGTGTISNAIATLASGASASFTIVALVSPSAPNGATITNTANVSTATTDPSSANNSQTATTTVQSQADVWVTNTTAAGPVLAGQTISYTVTVANAGPSDAQTVAMSDLVPTNTTFVSDTQTSGPSFTMTHPAVGGTGSVGGTIGTLAPGASASFAIVALVSPSTADGATITDTANASTATTDPNPANNSQTATTSVQSQADVSVTNTTTAVSVIAGNNITYTVIVANAGPSDAQAVLVSDLVPIHMTFVSDTQISGPTFTLSNPAIGGTGTISDTISSLAPGASASFTIVDRVSPNTPNGATITSTANVATAASDPNLTNNSRTVTIGSGSTPTVASVTSPVTTSLVHPKLSVLGADTGSGGEAGLTYTWSVAHAPAGAKPVTFSINGTNAAKHATAHVQKDGTYQLNCVISNSLGNSVTASVRLVITQLATVLRLTPHAQTVRAGASLQYAATALDQFGHKMRTTPTTAYAVESGGGTIDRNGLFTAGQIWGHVLIQIKDDGLTGTVGATISQA